MHTHDSDHIMALAESTFDTEPSAGSEFSSCRQCSDEFALQVLAIQAMRSTTSETLSELESARINRNLKHALGLMAYPTAKTPARHGRLATMAVLGAAAAILTTVVLTGNALQNRRANDDSADFFRAEGAPTTTVVLSSTSTTTETSAAFDADETPNGHEPLQSPGLTEDPLAVTAMDATALQLYIGVTTLEDLDELRDIVIEESGDVSSSLRRASEQGPSLSWAVQDTEFACENVQPAAVPGTVHFFTIALGKIGDTNVIVIAYVTDPLEDSVIIAHNASTCGIILQAPRP